MKKTLFILILIFMCQNLFAGYYYLANFNDGMPPNLKNGGYGAWSSYVMMSHTNYNQFGGFRYSIVLTYNVSSGSGGFWMSLAEGGLSIDLTQYDYLSFWIKGENGGEGFKIQLEDSINTGGEQYAFLHINNYLEGGEITTEWQKVVIPIQSFDPNEPFDLTQVKAMQFVFENGLGLNNSKVYIDEILFSTGTSLIYIDNMEFDEVNWGWSDLDALKWTINTEIGGGGVYSYKTNTLNTDHTNYLGYGSYKCDHNRGTGNVSTTWQLGYAGGNIFLDISACNKLKFYIKSRYIRTAGQGPRIHVDDSGYNESLAMPAIDSSWKCIEINLSDFGGGLDLTKILNFRLTTESGTAVVNSFWVDEIKFIDTIPPQAPTNIRVAGMNLENDFNFKVGDNIITATVYSNEPLDKSLEAVFVEYRKNKGEWKIVSFDYNTSRKDFTNTWNTVGVTGTNNIDLRVSSLDSSGHKSPSVIFSNCNIHEPSDSFTVTLSNVENSGILDFGDVPTTDIPEIAQYSGKLSFAYIEYNIETSTSWKIIVYTDNTSEDADPKYIGEGNQLFGNLNDGTGLVGNGDGATDTHSTPIKVWCNAKDEFGNFVKAPCFKWKGDVSDGAPAPSHQGGETNLYWVAQDLNSDGTNGNNYFDSASGWCENYANGGPGPHPDYDANGDGDYNDSVDGSHEDALGTVVEWSYWHPVTADSSKVPGANTAILIDNSINDNMPGKLKVYFAITDNLAGKFKTSQLIFELIIY